MALARRGEVALSACVACRGIWLEHGSLATLLQTGPDAVDRLCDKIRFATDQPRPAIQGPLRCSVCLGSLVQTEPASLSGVRLDACHLGHGQWVSVETLSEIASRTRSLLAAAGQTAAPAAPPTANPPPPAASPARPAAARRPANSLTDFVLPSTGAPQPAQPAPPPHPAPSETARAAGAPPQTAAPAAAAPGAAEILCPSCHARNLERAAACWACGGLLQKVAVGVCPQCQATIVPIRSGGLEVGACEGCGGVWMEQGLLGGLLMQHLEMQDALLENVRSVRTGSIVRVNPALVCVHCRNVMFAAPLGNLTSRPVHSCSTCLATFLPRGVLDEIILGRR